MGLILTFNIKTSNFLLWDFRFKNIFSENFMFRKVTKMLIKYINAVKYLHMIRESTWGDLKQRDFWQTIFTHLLKTIYQNINFRDVFWKFKSIANLHPSYKAYIREDFKFIFKMNEYFLGLLKLDFSWLMTSWVDLSCLEIILVILK